MMSKEKFIEEAKKLGYTDEMINEIVANHEEAEKAGIKLDYADDLIPLPVEDRARAKNAGAFLVSKKDT